MGLELGEQFDNVTLHYGNGRVAGGGMKTSLYVYLAVAAWAAPALAQNAAVADSSAKPADAPGQCEIHVWTADRLHSLTEGAMWNNVMDSAITPHGGRVTERAVPQAALDPEAQRAQLAKLPIDRWFHLPGASVTIHTEPARRRASVPATGRQTASTAPCYREVTIARNFFNRSGLTSRTLRTLVIYDEYGDQPAPTRSFVSWATTALITFPAKKPEDEAAAAAEILTAFESNVSQFSLYATTARAAK